MLNSSQFVDNFDSIRDNIFSRELLSNDEDSFAILSFNDLDFCSSPCLDDHHLLFASPKLSPQIHQNTDPNMARVTGRTVSHSEGDEYYPGGGSALSDLSPGVEFIDIDTLLRDPQNPADFLDTEEVGLFLGGGLKDAQDLDEDVGSTGQLSTIEVGGIDAAWLTSAIVIQPNQPKFKGTDPVEEKPFATNSSGKILQEICIPSSVQDSYDCIAEEEEIDPGQSVTDSSTEPTTSSKRRKRRRESADPGSDEYKKKRELNNISVRKSREKARQKQQETEGRVEVLATENNRLQERVDSLEKELTILKGLFSNIGASLPGEVTKFMSTE